MSRRGVVMAWQVEYTDEFEAWWDTLSVDEQDRVGAVVETLERGGPALGRPFVDNIHRSRHAGMKELRPRASSLRIRFAFDPRRMAILLIGGDKSGDWNAWYARMIPVADQLYDEHLDLLRREGEI